MKVYWTSTAVKNLQGIYDYVSQTSSQYADRIIDRLTKRSQQIDLVQELRRLGID